MLDIYRPCDNGHYVYVLYLDHLRVETYTSIIINFRLLAVNDYFFDIDPLCFVREEDLFYCGVNEYIKRNLKNENRLHLLWALLRKIDDGYLLMVAMRKENLKHAVRKEEDFIVNFPYDIWRQQPK